MSLFWTVLKALTRILGRMKILGLPEALELGLEWQRQAGAVILHIVAARLDESIDESAKLVLSGQGGLAGSLPDSISLAAIQAGKQALETGQSRVYSLNPNSSGGAIAGLQGGAVDIFAEVLPPSQSLIIVGAGHIAQPLAVLGKLLTFKVSIVDDRRDFANPERFPGADEILVTDFDKGLRSLDITPQSYIVLVTRGHVHDQACLRFALRTRAPYVGMIGSRMRIRTVMRRLMDEGFPRTELERVHAPIGIDIGSQTPAEIAVAIAAEIIDIQRGGRAPHLKLTETLRV